MWSTDAAIEKILTAVATRPHQKIDRMLTRFKELTEDLLPARARAEGWPIRFDHCFKRICLDAAFEDVWYRHLNKPAERHIEGEALARASEAAGRILTEGRPALDHLNRLSLTYRNRTAKIS